MKATFATTEYKQRLAEMLTPEFLGDHLPEPEGNRTKAGSARHLAVVCGEQVSFRLIYNWKNADFSHELDGASLNALCKILGHLDKTAEELQVYLRTGEWLPASVGQKIRRLLLQKKVIDQNLKALVVV